MNIAWNADKYTSNFSFVHNYGNNVAELINEENASTVLDLGCGNGALSKTLEDRGFKVKGIDASQELLDVAKKNYPDISFAKADATDFKVDKQVDVVFSNAVFHWIDEEQQLNMLSCVYDALKSGGQFVFEFGGNGNNKLIHNALNKIFEKHGYNYKMPFYFPTIGQYSPLLEKTGFKIEYATLFDRPTELKGEDGLKDWISMFVKIPFEKISDDEKKKIIEETVDILKDILYKDGKWYADYVRIRMKAVKK